MGLSVSNAVSPQVSQPNTTETTATESANAPAPAPPPAEPPKPQPDPASEAKTQTASKQNATEVKSQLDMRSQILREEISTKFLKGPGGGGGAPAGTDKTAPTLFKDTYTVHAGPSDNTTLADKAKAAGDGSKMPPPTTLKEFAYDKVAEKIQDSIGKLKPDLKREVHPKLSAEQEALHDVAAGMKKYQEYLGYARTTAAMLKVAPNNSAVKQALIKNLGDLDSLAGKLESAAGTLGKVGKYADLAKDALGTTRAVRELIQNTPKDFSDRKAVGKFADSLKNTSDNAQVWFDRGKDALLAAGKSGAGVAFSYFTGMISIGVDGLQAGVKNVNQYIDRMEKHIKLIENGGVAPKEMKPPDPPPPIKTYAQLRFDERMEKVGKVYDAVSHEFTTAADGVKRAFQARHKEVGEKFDKEVLPKLYMQNRDQFMKALQREVKDPKMYEKGAAATANAQAQLTRMQDRSASRLTPAQIQAEMRELQVYYGTPSGKNGGVTPLPVENLLKQYRPELDKFYEKHGFGEDALEKEYIRHGLTKQNKDQIYRQMIQELGFN